MTNYNSCSCNTCKNACRCKPGWFKPEEVEIAAKFMGLDVKTFFNKYLAVDWWENGNDIFILAPAIIGYEGKMYPAEPRGKCIFFKDEKCIIHSVHPYECKEYTHNCKNIEIQNRHKEVSKLWDKEEYQEWIEELLRHKPKSEEYNGGSLFNMF